MDRENFDKFEANRKVFEVLKGTFELLAVNRDGFEMRTSRSSR